MPSATETAMQALIAAITAQSGQSPSPFPVPTRNNTLPAQFKAAIGAFANVTCFFNVLDGNGKVHQETLGEPDQVADTYEIHHRAEIEWAVQGINDADREAAFDAGLVALNAALAADRSLGNAVSWCEIDETVRSNLATDALPNTKAIVVYVMLEFFSSQPF